MLSAGFIGRETFNSCSLSIVLSIFWHEYVSLRMHLPHAYFLRREFFGGKGC